MNTTFYAEYRSFGAVFSFLCKWSTYILHLRAGPGANITGRAPIEHFLTDRQAKDYTIDKVFLEKPKWIDFEYTV